MCKNLTTNGDIQAMRHIKQIFEEGGCRVVFGRGVVGIGKTRWFATFQELLGDENCAVVSADAYFHQDLDGTNPGNEYRFDSTKLAAAHKWAREQLVFHVGDGRLVFVDNTCLTPFDVDSYLQVVRDCGIKKSATLACNFRVPMLDSEAALMQKCVSLLRSTSGAELMEWAATNLNQGHQSQAEDVLQKNQQLFRCIPSIFELLWDEQRDSHPQLQRLCCQNKHSVPHAVVLRMLAQTCNQQMTTKMRSRFGNWVEALGWRDL